MTLDEILQIEDIGAKIALLKEKRSTPQPKVKDLRDDWDSSRHAVMNEALRPKRRVCVKEVSVDDDGKTHPAEYKWEDVNRIALPIEQDIVNIHTAFTVGTEPTLSCNPTNDKEKKLYQIVQAVNKENKIRYHNKRAARSWFSETEIAEYWYEYESKGFWSKAAARLRQLFAGKERPMNKLKCVIWSPFKGDVLYPVFDDSGDYVAQSREYRIKESRSKTVTYFQTVTATDVFVWKRDNGQWVEVPEKTFAHNFPKMPCIYAHRDEPLCAGIKTLRERLEKVRSNYADCIDYHFFPYLILEGDLAGENGLGNQDERRRMIKIMNAGKAYYLTWDQTPEAIKLEMDGLMENIYALTNTPRISFENMKSMGQVASGVAFRYTFMGAHMAVENHAEVLGEFLQRRYNFLVSAIGSLCPSLSSAAETIDIDVEIVPYMIDNIADKLDIAQKAMDAGLFGKRSAMVFVGLTDRIDEELTQVEKETSSIPAAKEPDEGDGKAA